ncbi:unknown protein [Desulfotalea psychrophila LSv54]|uniref:Uncharacterized protein n=1 Tax=Desulfotalea psychrophila (strain LSv54 / DSM 12343) TaxID=177439 RepID=Q6AP01_DESPS|nr:unknown protein [Desulfotalea psychrophila LSv54]
MRQGNSCDERSNLRHLGRHCQCSSGRMTSFEKRREKMDNPFKCSICLKTAKITTPRATDKIQYKIECPTCGCYFVSTTCREKFFTKCAHLTKDRRKELSQQIAGQEFHRDNIDWLL